MYAALHRPLTHMPSLLLAVIASVVAVMLAAQALTGESDRVATSPNYGETASSGSAQLDVYPSSVATEVRGIVATNTTHATNATNSQPLWQSDIMDSHPSIASLAALPKAGSTAAKVSANPSPLGL